MQISKVATSDISKGYIRAFWKTDNNWFKATYTFFQSGEAKNIFGRASGLHFVLLKKFKRNRYVVKLNDPPPPRCYVPGEQALFCDKVYS